MKSQLGLRITCVLNSCNFSSDPNRERNRTKDNGDRKCNNPDGDNDNIIGKVQVWGFICSEGKEGVIKENLKLYSNNHMTRLYNSCIVELIKLENLSVVSSFQGIQADENSVRSWKTQASDVLSPHKIGKWVKKLLTSSRQRAILILFTGQM